MPADTYACRIIYDLMDLVEIVGLVNLPTWTLSSLSCHSWNNGERPRRSTKWSVRFSSKYWGQWGHYKLRSVER